MHEPMHFKQAVGSQSKQQGAGHERTAAGDLAVIELSLAASSSHSCQIGKFVIQHGSIGGLTLFASSRLDENGARRFAKKRDAHKINLNLYIAVIVTSHRRHPHLAIFKL